jgi:hypothetical protein
MPSVNIGSNSIYAYTYLYAYYFVFLSLDALNAVVSGIVPEVSG